MTDEFSPSAIPSKRSNQRLRFLTVDDIAERLNVSTKTVRRRIKAGALPVHRIGRLVRVSEADFAAFLALQRDA